MTLEDWVVAHLQGKPAIVDVAIGGIYAQPLIPNPDGSTVATGEFFYGTPDAFDPDPPFRIRPSLSIHRLPRANHPSNWFGAYADMIEVWYYAPQTPEGRLAMDTLIQLVRPALSRVYAEYENWGGIFEPANDWVPPAPTPEFTHAISSVERFRLSAGNQF